ncbi:MAG: sel1 repeat family protein [Eggerthellaceae bacterium]|nr:sel1 repeat family protein [Eggerthellaceae bacterium]
MRKRTFAIVMMCCAFALTLGLVGCGGSSGGSSSGETSSEAAARAEAEAQAQAAEAQAALDEGQGYWLGTGESGYDMEKARAAFQQAADLGNAEGLYWLGVLRRNDVDADRWQEVMDYHQEAVDAGCARGLCGLGDLYAAGNGVDKDLDKAIELYQQAIDAGELYGCVCLGGLYQDGKGVDEDGARAAELYEQALASEDFSTRNAARCGLASLYFRGYAGIEVDTAKAEENYRAAADENYYGGWTGLSMLYSNDTYSSDVQGTKAEDNYVAAFEYDEKAAACGSPYNLGVDYENGYGCEQDYARALEVYNQAAVSGRNAPSAMCALASAYIEGRGVDVNYETATDWCNRALAAAGPGDEKIAERANELLGRIANNS